MTPKEKAEDLFNYYFDPHSDSIVNKAHIVYAKRCSIIDICENIKCSLDKDEILYWQEVKQEIELL